MSYRHVICLVVDGLRASALGSYGNTISPTPQFDAVASRALVADWFSADSPHLDGYYRSVWQGLHALRDEVAGEQESLLDKLKQSNILQWLVSDEPWLIEQAGHLPFDEALLFENDAEQAASELEDSTLGRFFSESIERLHQWRDDVEGVSSLAWLHCRGMFGPWDAPISMREALLDAEDPPAAGFVQPPAALRAVDDPDTLLAYRVAYSAQVKLLDACVGAFVEAVEEAFAGRDTLIVLTSSRGFALGEHGSIGTECAELYSERLHLPCLIYPGGNTTPLPRQPSLLQPMDLHATILDWFGQNETLPGIKDGISLIPSLVGKPTEPRQVAVANGNNGQRAIRTPAWWLIESPSDETSVQLFAKPSDRWESNDVAALCPGIVDGLTEELARAERCCREGEPLPTAPEDDELISPWE